MNPEVRYLLSSSADTYIRRGHGESGRNSRLPKGPSPNRIQNVWGTRPMKMVSSRDWRSFLRRMDIRQFVSLILYHGMFSVVLYLTVFTAG